jgi:pantetheine-phosphate adenylyltransferase
MSEKIIVYPISANPPTWGHADIMMRAATHFDKLIWVAATNPNKKIYVYDGRTARNDASLRRLLQA